MSINPAAERIGFYLFEELFVTASLLSKIDKPHREEVFKRIRQILREETESDKETQAIQSVVASMKSAFADTCPLNMKNCIDKWIDELEQAITQ